MQLDTIAQIKRNWEAEAVRMQKGEGHPGNVPPLPAISSDRYIRQDFYELEQREMWAKTWLLAGHTDELPTAGSYKLWEALCGSTALVSGECAEPGLLDVVAVGFVQ